MKNFIKYEIKGSYRFILGIIAIVLIASTIIQLNVAKEARSINWAIGTNMTGFEALIFILSILVIFGAFMVAIFYIIGSFRKELYEDRGYLTFTLPLSGNKILGGKLIVAMIWYGAIGLSIFLYNFLLALLLHGSRWLSTLKRVLSYADPGLISSIIISSIIVAGISIGLTLILIYFSIALSKVSVKNKKIGGLWFIIFIILNAIASYLVVKVCEAFPYFLKVNTLKIVHGYDIHSLASYNSGLGSMLLYGDNATSYINIIGNLFQLGLIVAGFIATGYIIEKKIDL